jgi:hypothetical protein
MEDVMLKMHPLPQSINDGGALVGMCGWKIMIKCGSLLKNRNGMRTL